MERKEFDEKGFIQLEKERVLKFLKGFDEDFTEEDIKVGMVLIGFVIDDKKGNVVKNGGEFFVLNKTIQKGYKMSDWIECGLETED